MRFIYLFYIFKKTQIENIKRVNTNPFLCGLWLIGVRDVDCSASSFVFSSATLSLVTICSSIWIFNMFPALFFIVAVVLVSSSNFQFYSYQFISKNSHCKPFVFVLLKSFRNFAQFFTIFTAFLHSCRCSTITFLYT